VTTLAVADETVYVGGAFTSIGGQERYQLAALDAETGLATDWNPAPHHSCDNCYGYSPDVTVIVPSDSTVYVAGAFDTIGGQARYHLAEIDINTGLATAWDPNPNAYSYISDLAVHGATVYVGGYFTSVGGQSRNNIAALDATTGLATSWNPDLKGDFANYMPPGVSAIVTQGSTVYAGGNFTQVGELERDNVAALDTTTGIATDWNPKAGGGVAALAISDSTVYVGGDFTSIGAVRRNNIAALDADSGAAIDWDPSASGVLLPYGSQVCQVCALAISGNMVFTAGSFASIGGQWRNNIAVIDAVTGLATDWNPDADNQVAAFAVLGNMVYVGGGFTNIGGQARSHIAALDDTTGLATAWDTDADGHVAAVEV